jgi:putative transposase
MTFYKWKSKYGGLEVSDMKRLKELEAENRRLKQIYAECELQNRVLKDVIEKSSKPVECKALEDQTRELFGISVRQACAWFAISWSMFY